MMMRFFAQMNPKILPVSVTPNYPGCLTFVKGNLVHRDPVRKFSESDKSNQRNDQQSKEEKEEEQMPGFVHPNTMNEAGYFTQRAKQQIEELKKKKEKPSLRHPERKD
ncbi:unnamed protein product [Chrysodeixis includens]|uniref:Uncharacterized protein n=1 Tax=Chrysodeixis includens TaxID=689277 RepID=A0A9N8PZY4_CHRIL|nr:unnamed protein product [Chrysodeixis includens]